MIGMTVSGHIARKEEGVWIMMGKREDRGRGSRVIRSIAVVLAAMLTAVLAFSLVGCGSQLDIAKMLEAEGRPFNNVTTGKVGDTLTNTFFEWTVKSAVVKDSLTVDGEEYLPYADGYKFLLVDITTKNVFDKTNPMSNTDFSIIWSKGDDTVEDYAYSEFMNGMYPDELMQAVGESDGGILVFEVPGDVHSAFIAYYEIWSDDFEGDTYLFEVTF
jgi:hypothetical protein